MRLPGKQKKLNYTETTKIWISIVTSSTGSDMRQLNRYVDI
jgi:hypothetical protein